MKHRFPLQPNLYKDTSFYEEYENMRNIFVGDKICPGAEHTEIKSSTTNTEDVQADENDTVTSTTAGTAQT